MTKKHRTVWTSHSLLVLKRFHQPGYEVWRYDGDRHYTWTGTYDSKAEAIAVCERAIAEMTGADTE